MGLGWERTFPGVFLNESLVGDFRGLLWLGTMEQYWIPPKTVPCIEK